MHQSFLTHNRFRDLKLALGLTAAAIVAYMIHDPLKGPNGGTWLGYTLGTIGAALILILLWYGIRKRQFHSTAGAVRGWLSFHVYFGLALVVISTLHAGFQVGWNIHTLAYVLMLLVVATGIYGIVVYRRYPVHITENRTGIAPSAMLDEIGELEQECIELADNIDDEVHQVVLRSLQGQKVGGNLWTQLRGGPRKQKHDERNAEQLLKRRDEELSRRMEQYREEESDKILRAESTMQFVAGQLAEARPGEEVEKVRELLTLLGRRRALVRRLNRDIQQRALLQIWLYLHIPLSVGLLAALIAHIISVFYYW